MITVNMAKYHPKSSNIFLPNILMSQNIEQGGQTNATYDESTILGDVEPKNQNVDLVWPGLQMTIYKHINFEEFTRRRSVERKNPLFLDQSLHTLWLMQLGYTPRKKTGKHSSLPSPLIVDPTVKLTSQETKGLLEWSAESSHHRSSIKDPDPLFHSPISVQLHFINILNSIICWLINEQKNIIVMILFKID